MHRGLKLHSLKLMSVFCKAGLALSALSAKYHKVPKMKRSWSDGHKDHPNPGGMSAVGAASCLPLLNTDKNGFCS